MRRRRRSPLLLVGLLMVAGLLLAADFTARVVAEEELTARVREKVPEAGSADAKIRSLPFLGRLLLSGRVPQVDASVTDVTVRGLRIAAIAVDLHGVTLDRDQLVNDRRVVLREIERGRVRAEVRQAALSERLGVPVTLEDGRASVTFRGQRIAASLAVRDGRLVVGGAGLSLPALDVIAPLLPCVANAEIEQGRVVLTCDFTEVPEELRVDVQL